jgi:hypothetical protein
MARLDQIIKEIQELRQETSHRSALRIYNLLENNKKLFLEKIDPDYFNFITKNFENVSNVNPLEFTKEGFLREYQTYYESLMFHLNKII